MIKLKDFIEKISENCTVYLMDKKDGKHLFSCHSDSKALENYADWNVKDISFVASIFGMSYAGIKIYISEV